MPRFLIAYLISVLILVSGACHAADHTATFVDADSRIQITIDLEAAHPYLAEYGRILEVSKAGSFSTRVRLAADTGGYAAVYLYRCSENTFMLVAFFESVVIDGDVGSVRTGKCPGKLTFIGMFDGAGSQPWRFYPASQRREPN